jgi:hypothetical protein
VERKGIVVYNRQEKGIIIKKSKKIVVRRRSRVVVCSRYEKENITKKQGRKLLEEEGSICIWLKIKLMF